MVANIDTIKTKLIKYFSSHQQVKMAFLYGSYAKGRQLPGSDIDIAVYLTEGYSKDDIDSVWDELIALLKKDVELLVLNDANEAIAWAAIRGIPLAVKDQKLYLNFMLAVSSAAMDLQQDLEEIWQRKQEKQNAR
ncbi:MAG: nucleotidyltransferase domain-containing protein [bacterium]